MQGHGHGHLFQMKRIYVHFRRAGDNAHGNTVGFHGSLNPNSLYSVLRSLNVDGGDFVDFGAGDGKPLAAALYLGASRVHGFELPQNSANKLIFDASMRAMSNTVFLQNPRRLLHAQYEMKDIEEVRTLHFSTDTNFQS